ncbi:chitobiase [Bacteroidia bacterium]|nr:chitobiase [Bacteroidia bacterium]GHT51785.1 chitobiase [Bacteroidia bacterium]
MKKIYKKLLPLAGLIFIFSACENMMDIHEKYLEGGEIIYAPKLDSLQFYPGKERILFRFWLNNAPNVKEVVLYWDTRKDSLVIPVTPSSLLDSVSVFIPNLEERTYSFEAKTIDTYGHQSLLSTGISTAYGDIFQSTLGHRQLKELELNDIAGLVYWYTAPANLAATEVRYTDRDNNTQISWAPASESFNSCLEAKPNTTVEYRSLYIPEPNAVDTFYSEWRTEEKAFPATYLIDKSKWSIVACSDENANSGNGVANIIDNDITTWWNSQWEPETAPLPHWAIIDMGASKGMLSIDSYRRPGNPEVKTVQYYVGNDPDPDASTWVQIAEGIFTSGDLLTIEIPESINTRQGQYLKVVLPDSNGEPFTSLAEIYIRGK